MRTAILAVLMLCLCVPANAAEKCVASIYTTKDRLQNGTKTASGIPLNDGHPTIAHKKRPLNSVVNVTNMSNGTTKAFKVTDRGPFIAGRCVDLSMAAAILLGCRGLCPVVVR